MLIDFHTHSKRETDEVIEVVSIHPHRKEPWDWYTVGYHPWWVNAMLTNEELDFLKNKLESDKHCLALGECGLDRLKGVSLALQERVFLQQVELANALGAPVIVHCVRAYDRIVQLHQQHAQTPWVVHGYRRKPTLAHELLRKGMYLSVAPDAQMAPTFVETLKMLPQEQFFIETDSDTSMNISQRYELLASIKKVDICELEIQMVENFKTFFRWKQHGLSEQRF